MPTIDQLGHKGIFCSIIVKAKMNGSSVASLDNYFAKDQQCLQVHQYTIIDSCLNNYFHNQTHLFEQSHHITKVTNYYFHNTISL
jgi:hypothetical protein